ncbi:hypothetical protein VTJ83DRAFT_3456 [Remersonia thermophila]|uniref:CID domain-containing protein n=1 Tax=Remersonia thermophila TaxID=72144 RepID=A0ABR4DE19_9PEZI
MAPAELIVAKTALSGALFRPDPRPCSRDDIESLFSLVSSAITECSPSNVQRCKQWALNNLVSSSARVTAFAKYLVALAKSLGGDADAAAPTSRAGRVPSARRRRLHLLYLLNDVLYHVKFRSRDDAWAQKLEPWLPALVKTAASFNNCPKHMRKLQSLIDLWEDKGYFSDGVIPKLRLAVQEGPSSAGQDAAENAVDTSAGAVAKAAKTAPWVLPAMHGDPTTPWYDLPAGNWLPVLEPNSARPMNPSMIKPLVLSQGPADKALVNAAKDLLAAVDRIYSTDGGHDENAAFDINQLGERIDTDEVTGEAMGGETYYGWSRAFCEKMKRRGRNENEQDDRGRTSSSRSYSRAETRSRSRRRGHSEALQTSKDVSFSPGSTPWSESVKNPRQRPVAEPATRTQEPQPPPLPDKVPVPLSFQIPQQQALPAPKPLLRLTLSISIPIPIPDKVPIPIPIPLPLPKLAQVSEPSASTAAAAAAAARAATAGVFCSRRRRSATAAVSGSMARSPSTAGAAASWRRLPAGVARAGQGRISRSARRLVGGREERWEVRW